MSEFKVLLATLNQGKVDEFRRLLADLPVQVVSLYDLDPAYDVIEDGRTFAENAQKKAEAAADRFHYLAVADDSGLEVDALKGQPGVHSARFAGRQGDDEANNDKLLQLLADVPFEKRTARFRCSIALAGPRRKTMITEGVCEGMIAFERMGEHGFGYDPLFWVSEYDQTFAELRMEIKNQISHRARAFQKMKKILEGLF